MICLQPTGSKVLVNRIKEHRESSIINLPTAKESGNHKGTILVKGKGSPLCPLNDLHVFDVITYTNCVTVPPELQEQLDSTYGDKVSGILDIVSYEDIHATL